MNNAADNTSKLLLQQAAAHGLVFLLAWAAWAALDSWALLTHLALAQGLSVLVAIASGVVLSHLLHEWGHFLGAVLSKSVYTVKATLSPLFFDFDYLQNQRHQYLWLSAGGPVGNVVLLALLWGCLPLDTAARVWLLATCVGQLVYVLVLEGPVSLGILRGKEPLQVLADHFGQGRPLFVRATLCGVGAGLVMVWLMGLGAPQPL